MPTQPDQSIIIIEEERLKESFTQIPNTILRRQDLSPGAKLTYIGLLSYAWQTDSCFPGQPVLAKDIGVSKRSIVSYLQELQSKGLLKVKRRGLGQTNVYTLTRWAEPRSADSALPEVQKTTLPEVRNLRAKNTQREEDTKNIITDDVAQLLIDFGISKSVARRLATEYPPERIHEKLELVEYLQATNSPLVGKSPPGWLIRAIEEDFTKPKEFKSRVDREREAAVKAEQDRQREAEAAAIERAQAHRREAIRAFIAGQPAKPITGTDLDTKTAWAQVLERLQAQLSPLNYQLTVADSFLADYRDGEVVIGTPSTIAAQQLETKFAPFLTKALMDVLGVQSPPRLFFEVARLHPDQEPAPTISPRPS